MRVFLFFVGLSVGLPAMGVAQIDTTFYFSYYGEPVREIAQAWEYYQVNYGTDVDTLTRFYRSADTWQQEWEIHQKLSDSTYEVHHAKKNKSLRKITPTDAGYWITDVSNGVTWSGFSKRSSPLLKEGTWTYATTDRKLSEHYFQNNRLTGNTIWNEDGSVFCKDVFSRTDTPLLFNGGGIEAISQWINQRIRYPKEEMLQEVTGQVIIQFVLSQEGQVNGIRIKKSVSELLDNEAIRVVSMLPNQWTVPSIGGEKVNSLLELPITFRLE